MRLKKLGPVRTETHCGKTRTGNSCLSSAPNRHEFFENAGTESHILLETTGESLFACFAFEPLLRMLGRALALVRDYPRGCRCDAGFACVPARFFPYTQDFFLLLPHRIHIGPH